MAAGVWCDTGPVSIVGMRLTATMTVLDLGKSGLLLHSPLSLTPERRASVLSLGEVTELYAPNTFHQAWLGEWSQAFPEARVHAPAALATKRPDLRIDRFHDREKAAGFSDRVMEIPIDGFRLVETVLVHCPSETAVVTDLVHNVGRPTDPWTKLYSRAMGFYDRVALSRAIRWTAFSDRRAARRSIDVLLSQQFDRDRRARRPDPRARTRSACRRGRLLTECVTSVARGAPSASPTVLVKAVRVTT